MSQSWNVDPSRASVQQMFEEFGTSARGLDHADVGKRTQRYGRNELARKRAPGLIERIFRQLINPLVLLLVVVGTLSGMFGSWFSASVIYLMAGLSAFVAALQEHRAEVAAEHLISLVRATAEVMRDGVLKEVPFSHLVPGDIVHFSVGDVIPADVRIIESDVLHVDQSALTGEAFPVPKNAEPAAHVGADLTRSPNMAFVGSHVTSGTGVGLVVCTGADTFFGKIAGRLSDAEVETAFDTDLKKFTWLLIRIIVFMATTLLFINAVRNKDILESLLFAVTAAVQISPEILPMVVMFNLSKGAIAMSKKKVVVKRLDAIQNFGGMDVLCSDKTGTLTMNAVVLQRNCDVTGIENDTVYRYGYINSHFQTGLKNTLDKAILAHKRMELHQLEKVGEIPFDFERKIMSVIVRDKGKILLVSKGAPEEIVKRCDSSTPTDQPDACGSLSMEGFRVLAVAVKEIEDKPTYAPSDESGMKLVGYMAFFDPLKPSARGAIEELEHAGIAFKVITGDSEIVARKICGDVGLDVTTILTGDEIETMTETELDRRVEGVSVFARILPLQKERIIRALRHNGHTVGFLGDGINDAPALKAADIGISVNNAVDVAKESASIILLKQNLHVILDGVKEGRGVFGNFMKYIRTSTSFYAGFLISTTLASIALPFLPLLPLQILLNNYLSDILQVVLPADAVDEEYLKRPKVWRIGLITRYMFLIGPINVVFDVAIMGILILFFNGLEVPELFRTGWFLGSTFLQLLAICAIRTQKIPFIQSRPSKAVSWTIAALVFVLFVLPYTQFAGVFGLVHMPVAYFLLLPPLAILYLMTIHYANSRFIARFEPEAV